MPMRHRPTLILTSLLLLASACSRDFDADDMPVSAPEPEQEQGYVVPVEQALQSLDNELAMICGGDETRAAQPRRRVKAVRNVAYADVAPATRSDEMPDDVSDLFYIVEFADGEGSAVLGADKRVEPVVAILDQTVLTPEDFAAADIQSDDITSYMTALMVNSANGGILDLDSIRGRYPIYIVDVPERDTINRHKQPALLSSNWHQGSPFNNKYPFVSSGEHCQAGCGVIAVAQILTYNQYPNVLNIYDNLFYWNIINKLITHPDDQSASDTEHLASFIYNLGSLMHMENDLINNRTGTYIENAANAMRQLGYRYVASHAFSYSDAQDMICNDKLVFLMNGYDSKNVNSRHEWVVDGWNEYTVRLWRVTYNTRKGGSSPDPLEISRELIETTNVKKMHCNFGWGGECNGYYTYNLFKTNNYTFDCNFNMITYSLPQ